jgi:hypothetical protein
LFDEQFEAEDVILATTEDIPIVAGRRLPAAAYAMLYDAISKNDPAVLGKFDGPSSTNNTELSSLSIAARVGKVLAQDPRTWVLREHMVKGPREVAEVADEVFPDASPAERIGALTTFADILNRAEQPHSDGPFLSVRYHLFLRALEGAFIRYAPKKEIALARQNSKEGGGLSFELALCRECGQHYLVGRKVKGFLAEAVRDPSRDDFGVSFFRPVSNKQDEEESEVLPHSAKSNLCAHCGILWPVGSRHDVIMQRTFGSRCRHPPMDMRVNCSSAQHVVIAARTLSAK